MNWLVRTGESKPLGDILKQNTENYKKTRESKVKLISEKTYNKIAEKLIQQSTHSDVDNMIINVSGMFQENQGALLLEMLSGDKSFGELCHDEYTSICTFISGKLSSEKLNVQVVETSGEDHTDFALNISWKNDVQ